jgi:hypothetical protein
MLEYNKKLIIINIIQLHEKRIGSYFRNDKEGTGEENFKNNFVKK